MNHRKTELTANGLHPLQIEEYMNEVAATNPFVTTAEVAEANRLKRLRQEAVFDRPPGKLAAMRFIINEACLLRIRQATFYGNQVERIRSLADLDGVEILVLPLDRGIHPAMTSSFKLMSFEGPYSPEILYLESHYGARYVDDRRSVARLREVFSDTLTYVVPVEEYLSNVEP